MQNFLSSSKAKSKKKKGKFDFEKAPDIEKSVKELLGYINLEWVKEDRVFCYRSYNSKTKAYARIWGLSRIFQEALSVKPAYVIEVISERFDGLSEREKAKVLLHEIAHIPTTFSGSLLPHKRKGKFKFNDKVDGLVAKYLKNKK